jgi:hypothetical protein
MPVKSGLDATLAIENLRRRSNDLLGKEDSLGKRVFQNMLLKHASSEALEEIKSTTSSTVVVVADQWWPLGSWYNPKGDLAFGGH